MKLFLQYLLLFLCLLSGISQALAQDERTFLAYQKQAQRYESQKHYRQAIDAYRKALPYANSENRKQIDQDIIRLDELVQMEQLVIQGLANNILKKISTLESVSTRNRLKTDLSNLQNQGDATKSDYQSLMRQVDVVKQSEVEPEDRESSIVGRPPRPSPKRPATPVPRAYKPGGPPPKTVTVSVPGRSPKGPPDVRSTKSAGSLRSKSSN